MARTAFTPVSARLASLAVLGTLDMSDGTVSFNWDEADIAANGGALDSTRADILHAVLDE